MTDSSVIRTAIRAAGQCISVIKCFKNIRAIVDRYAFLLWITEMLVKSLLSLIL